LWPQWRLWRHLWLWLRRTEKKNGLSQHWQIPTWIAVVKIAYVFVANLIITPLVVEGGLG
jgi:hypothetical protein